VHQNPFPNFTRPARPASLRCSVFDVRPLQPSTPRCLSPRPARVKPRPSRANEGRPRANPRPPPAKPCPSWATTRAKPRQFPLELGLFGNFHPLCLLVALSRRSTSDGPQPRNGDLAAAFAGRAENETPKRLRLLPGVRIPKAQTSDKFKSDHALRLYQTLDQIEKRHTCPPRPPTPHSLTDTTPRF
jgi:hypothetical protein